jgi:hypothetical protein
MLYACIRKVPGPILAGQPIMIILKDSLCDFPQSLPMQRAVFEYVA